MYLKDILLDFGGAFYMDNLNFTEEQKKALQNAPIFYHDNELEHTCNG